MVTIVFSDCCESAGKDRTGVIAAIILKVRVLNLHKSNDDTHNRVSVQLAGVTDEDIAEDYALTRVGREPSRQKIMARLSKMPMFASNSEAAQNMFTCR